MAAQDVQRSAYPDAYAPWQAIAAKLVATFTGTTGPCSTIASGPDSAAAATAVDYAQGQIGIPYEYGGDGPGVNGAFGFDCSGLSQAAYLAAGISLERTAQEQYNTTRKISTSQLAPGDLVFFGTSLTNITHVGIYAGDNMMIDAPHTGAFVREENYQWSDYLAATDPSAGS